MQVLWVYGTSCVGKSATCWELFAHADLGSARVAYVDIDQLGMCYPASAEDPEREHLKSTALRGLVRSAEASGVDLLVVSGILSADQLKIQDDMARADGDVFTYVRLTLASDELADRC